MKIVYHQGLTFGSATLNRFHPFEFNRADVALAKLKSEFDLKNILIEPESPIALADLGSVHSAEYLQALKSNATVAKVIEVPFLKWCPSRWVDGWFRKPASWSVACTMLAARAALETGFALCLGGGFHHAKRNGGEGFCLVSDIAFAVETLRTEGGLEADDRWMYLDLDVHQGNGVSDYYKRDKRVRSLDFYNKHIYPVYGRDISSEVEFAVPLDWGCDDSSYLELLETKLEQLIDGWDDCKLMVYNAGTDVFEGDRLGGIALSRDGVSRRDQMVMEASRSAKIPLLVLASGGYSKMSANLLSDFAITACKAYL